MNKTLRDLATLATLGSLLCLTGCLAPTALDRAVAVSQTCGSGGTNICIIYLTPEGGATLSALTGIDTNAWRAISNGAAAGAKAGL